MISNLKIGISAKFHNRAPVFYGESERHIQYLETPIAKWIAQNNALPLMIPSESTESELSRKILDVAGYANELDGLILQGGVDVHPSLYGGNSEGEIEKNYTYDLVRDKYELALINAFIEKKKPILGICRGLQLLNVYLGGTLHTDIESSGYIRHLDKDKETKHSHVIEIKDGGILSKIYSKQAHAVSIHHQGIKDLGKGLFIEAISPDDGLIEAISAVDDDRFILAVQWHPEFHTDHQGDYLEANKLLHIFTTVARNRKFFGELTVEKKKSVKFSKSAALSVGAELELQLVDPATLDLTPVAPQLLADAKNTTGKIKSEIFQSMIEIETDVCSDVCEIEKDLMITAETLKNIANHHGVLLGSAGTHPFALYSDRKLTQNSRYAELIKSKQWIARRIAIFGLHCHVGVQSPQQAIELYRFYLSMAPLLLGLSSSSPFFQSEKTGLSSVRSTFFESTPAGGHPPIINNWSEFEGLMTKLLKSKSIESHKDLWWDVRPSLNYGTIEIRICDMLPSINENIALIAFVHLLGHAYLSINNYRYWPHLSEWSYRENKWRALRYGLDFDFIFNEDGNSRPAREFILSILDDLHLLSGELGYDKYINLIREKMILKTPAQSMVEKYKETSDLQSVVKLYCDKFMSSI